MCGVGGSFERCLLNIKWMASIRYRVLTNDDFAEEFKRNFETQK